MKSPLIIIVELLFGLVTTIYQTIAFVVRKFVELMISLMAFSTLGIFGFFLALGIGAIIFLLVAKFVFRTWKSLLGFGIALIVVVLILVLLWVI